MQAKRNRPNGRICPSCGEVYVRRGRPGRCTGCAASHRVTEAHRVATARIVRHIESPVMVRGRRSPRPRLFIMGYCSECGDGFLCSGRHMGPQRSGWRVFCSDACRRRTERRDHRHRRRAGRAGQRIYRAKVFERDGYCCRLCGDPLDLSADVPHPLAPVIDHIVPLALGGEHAHYNVQAAHFMCNSEKRDLLDGQVAMPV